jgi:hypothetical protein
MHKRRSVMRKTIVISLLASVILVAFVPICVAEMSKEGTSSGIMSYSGTFKALPMGQERVHMTYEVMGVFIGEGLLNNSSFRCIGALHSMQGTYKDDSGSCVYTSPDGDQAFATYEAAGKSGGPGKGTYKWVGGTGKLTGIEGGGEFDRISVRPVAQGTFQGYAKTKGHWRIPEAKK